MNAVVNTFESSNWDGARGEALKNDICAGGITATALAEKYDTTAEDILAQHALMKDPAYCASYKPSKLRVDRFGEGWSTEEEDILRAHYNAHQEKHPNKKFGPKQRALVINITLRTDGGVVQAVQRVLGIRRKNCRAARLKNTPWLGSKAPTIVKAPKKVSNDTTADTAEAALSNDILRMLPELTVVQLAVVYKNVRRMTRE